MITEIKSESNSAIKITGNAEISVVEGKINIMGIELSKNNKFKIQGIASGQIFQNSTIKIDHDGNTIIETTKVPICKNYDKFMDLLIEKVSGKKQTKYLFVGHIDAGKSTMLIAAANRLISNGYKVGILDLDVGQSISKRPASITYSIVNEISINELKLTNIASRFVGVLSPYNFEYRTIAAAKMVLQHATDVDVILIDTPGWIQDARARDYMYSIYETLDVDMIFSFGNYIKLRPFIKLIDKRNIHHLYVGKSIFAESRNWQIRKTNRENAFSELFKDSKYFEIPLSEVVIEYSQIGSGIPIDLNIADETILWAETIEDYLIIITKGLDFEEIENFQNIFFDNKTKIIIGENLIGLVVGLMDAKGLLIGYGKIHELKQENDDLIFVIESNIKEDKIKGLAFSLIRLDENFKELDRLKPRDI